MAIFLSTVYLFWRGWNPTLAHFRDSIFHYMTRQSQALDMAICPLPPCTDRIAHIMSTTLDSKPTPAQVQPRTWAIHSTRSIFLIAVAALCMWALLQAIRTSNTCQWPAEWDTLRDMGMAQTLLDGNYPKDPILSGKTLWYNPLTGALLAASSRVLQLPLHQTSIALGPYVNLLAPLGIVVLLAFFFGRAAALAGLCMVLFAKDPQTPFWVNASYSPWLLAPLYSLGLFFLTLVAYYHALSRRSLAWHGVAGLLLGITFMAHTAPAMVIGGVIVATTSLETGLLWHRQRQQRRAGATDSQQPLWRIPAQVLVLLMIAFVVSLPFTWSILWHYQFKVHNPFPSLFAADYVSLAQLPDRLRDTVNWKNLFALTGIMVLVRRFRRDSAARFILCWLIVAIAFVTQHYLWQYLLTRGTVLTSFVPGHHAAIHLSAVRAVLFAVGLTASGIAVIRLLQRLSGLALQQQNMQLLDQIAAVIAVALAGTALYMAHPLTTRVDFMTPDRALYHQFHEQGIPMYQWILENTEPNAVFLCDEESIGMTVVMPAGRKLVSAMLLYSNPYVPAAPLFEAQKNLLNAIENGNQDKFCQLASPYPVLYLLVHSEKSQAHHEKYRRLFDELEQAGNLVVWRARACTE